MAGILSGENNYSGGINFGINGVNPGSGVASSLNFDLPLATVAQFQNNAFAFAANNTARSQGFYQQTQLNADRAVAKTENQFFQFATSGLNSLTGLASVNIASIERMNQLTQEAATERTRLATKRKGGCFITTAACESRAMADDCHVLQTLRHFRDTFMKSDSDGRAMVAEYYEVAPYIVEKIKRDYPDSWAKIFGSLFDKFILPAVEAIENGDNEKALRLYVALFVVAKTAAGV